MYKNKKIYIVSLLYSILLYTYYYIFALSFQKIFFTVYEKLYKQTLKPTLPLLNRCSKLFLVFIAQRLEFVVWCFINYLFTYISLWRRSIYKSCGIHWDSTDILKLLYESFKFTKCYSILQGRISNVSTLKMYFKTI